MEKPVRDRIAPGLPMGALDDAVAAYNKPESERTPTEVATVYGLLSRDGRIRPADWPRLLGPDAASRRLHLIAELDRATKAAPVRCRRPAGSTSPGRMLRRPISSAAGNSPRAGRRSSRRSRPSCEPRRNARRSRPADGRAADDGRWPIG